MRRKNFVPGLDVIMIAFYPRNSTRKDDTIFFGVSTILIASFFFCYLELLSDFFLLLIIGCTGSMSMGDLEFLLRVTISLSKRFRKRVG